MSDTLEIFGAEYQGVTGIKATDNTGAVKTYIRPQGSRSITANGTVDVTTYASVTVNVAGGGTAINNQNKTVSPTESQQNVTADSGYTGLGTVTVNAISSSYVGSEITRKAATTYNTSSTDQTISSGQYLTGAQTIKAVTTANLSAANIKAGVVVKVGDTNDDDRIAAVTGTYTSDANASATDILSGKTAYVNGAKVTGTVTFQTIYSGMSDPSSSTGVNGDVYIKTA